MNKLNSEPSFIFHAHVETNEWFRKS